MVFHSPPLAVATYQMLRLRGSTATSATRPEFNAGPMPRKASAASGPSDADA